MLLSAFIALAAFLSVALAPTRVKGAIHSTRTGCSSVSYPTYHFDKGRTGWNDAETTLTTSNVQNLKLVAKLPVDGMVEAQPLVAACQNISGQSVDLLIVATLNNSLYAFNADTGATVWYKHFETPTPSMPGVNCFGGRPSIGILSTPTIDTNSGLIYFVTATGKPSQAAFILHAVSLTSGTLVRTTTIKPNLSSPPFTPGTLFQRPALAENVEIALNRSDIYVAFGSQCEISYDDHGWLFAYNENDFSEDGVLPTTQDTAPPEVPCTPTPKATGNDHVHGFGSIWQSDFGVASDGDTYFATGNGSFTADTNHKDFSMSIVNAHLGVSQHQPTGLEVADWFTPADWCANDIADKDLGTSGVALLPTAPVSLAAIEDHYGTLYLVNRSALGHTGGNGVYSIQLSNPPDRGLWGGPVYWEGASGSPRIAVSRYVASLKNPFGFQTFTIIDTASRVSASAGFVIGGQPETGSDEGGNSPIVTSNGHTNGSYLLWLLTRPPIVSAGPRTASGQPVRLEAFNPEAGMNETTPLVSIPLTPRLAGFAGGQYWSPTVVNGHVYAGSYGSTLSTGQVFIFALNGSRARVNGSTIRRPHP
ncbi:MAG: PQQ-binding-like beta-propeller repeat protein [Candidatus Eremiobacteraeota bacterium]|nr:PQQ-binding-like beta-propeller repeat protein [Candidatus Eremiobacteraeota bacterium]